VERHGALPRDVRAQFRTQFDANPAAVAAALDPLHGGGAVDVTLDEVSSQPVSQAERAFQIDRIADAEMHQGGHGQSLGHGVGMKAVPAPGGHSQAYPIDRDALTVGQLRHRKL